MREREIECYDAGRHLRSAALLQLSLAVHGTHQQSKETGSLEDHFACKINPDARTSTVRIGTVSCGIQIAEQLL